MPTATTAFEPRFSGIPHSGVGVKVRQIGRAIGFASVLAMGIVRYFVLWMLRRTDAPIVRARWLQKISRQLMRVVDLRVRYIGQPEDEGLFVFNHVSYLDIVALAARHPVVFVAKKEVRSWPVIGWIAEAAGTLFIDREKRGDVARIAEVMQQRLEQGIRVCIFPEGTSSDGTRVLPFRTSLLEPAIAQRHPVTAGWIGYRLEDGAAETEVCYWGDLSFGPHLLNLFSKRCILGRVAYRPAGLPGECRKQLGQRLHALVSQLSKQGV